MIACKIDVTKIDKAAIYVGTKGKYVDMMLVDNKDGPDQYGNDGFVAQGLSKERREAGERGPIIGNWRRLAPAGSKVARPAPRPAPPAGHEDDVPF